MEGRDIDGRALMAKAKFIADCLLQDMRGYGRWETAEGNGVNFPSTNLKVFEGPKGI